MTSEKWKRPSKPRGKAKRPKRPWQEVATEAQAYREETLAQVPSAIPAVPDPLPLNVMQLPERLLTERECWITGLSIDELLAKLAGSEGPKDRLTATEVTEAYLRRAGLAQRLANCVTELVAQRALERAKFLDSYFQEHGKPLGPLHGLPISVKEHIGLAGLRMTSGYVAFWDKIASEDAHVLQILWNAGAIFHARTTEPQTMMHLETDNNFYGITVNPYNSNLTAGGSSGGEGALIGLGGSILGIGTDVGGSIRSPASNNGLYGLKPTSFRIPTDGWSSIAAAVDSIPTCLGPLSRSLTGIELFMKTVLAAKPWLTEPALVPLPWNPASFAPPSSAKPLKIAVMWHDEVVVPHPPVSRALKELSSRLKSIPNLEVVEWKPYLHDEAWAIISSLYFTDGGDEDAEAMAASGEPWRPLSEWIINENPCVKKLSMHELWYWEEEREAYRKEYAKVWNDTATGRSVDGELMGTVDAILCPVGPGVAPKHNTARYWCYTSQWNLLDYPALVFPVTKVDPEVDVAGQHTPLSELDQENWELYDPKTFAGLPVNLQLVCRRFEDEKVVEILKYIQAHVQLPLRG